MMSVLLTDSSPVNEFFRRERDILSKRRELLARGLLSYLPPAPDNNDTDKKVSKGCD